MVDFLSVGSPHVNALDADVTAVDVPAAVPAGLPADEGARFVRLPLRAPTVGTEIVGAAVVRGKEEAKTKAGDPYLTVTLGTREGQIKGKIWREAVGMWADIDVGRGVDVRGLIKPGYQGGLPELDIRTVTPLEPGHPIEREMHPVSPVPYARLVERYEHLVACLTPRGTALLRAVMDTLGEETYRLAPAAVTHHHAYLHGLLEHSVEVAELAVALTQHSPAALLVEWDALIVGALLHDIGKVHEYQWTGGPIRVDVRGVAMSYHTVSGQLTVERAWHTARGALEAAGVRERDIEHVQHVIASHHNTRDAGSVVPPCTLEAVIIHQADDASAKLRSRVDDLCSGPADDEGWVVPVGWRKAPVLSLLPPHVLACARGEAAAVAAAEQDADDLAAFGDGGATDGLAATGAGTERPGGLPPMLTDVLAAVRAFGTSETAAREAIRSPGGDGPTAGPRRVSEDLLAYLTYLVTRDLAQWDARRRLPAEEARALASQLRDTLSAERQAALDAFLERRRAA